LNAQAIADIALFRIQDSEIDGAGAGVFVTEGVSLPPNFLVAG
jgi:hypothetical protein